MSRPTSEFSPTGSTVQTVGLLTLSSPRPLGSCGPSVRFRESLESVRGPSTEADWSLSGVQKWVVRLRLGSVPDTRTRRTVRTGGRVVRVGVTVPSEVVDETGSFRLNQETPAMGLSTEVETGISVLEPFDH